MTVQTLEHISIRFKSSFKLILRHEGNRNRYSKTTFLWADIAYIKRLD